MKKGIGQPRKDTTSYGYVDIWAGLVLLSKGQDRFMVRPFRAIDRLPWTVALAHALMVLALRDGKLAGFRAQAIRLITAQTVLGRRLTVGKLAQAIGLDFVRHRRAWAYPWLM